MDIKLHVKSVPVTSNSCEFESRSWQGVLHRTLCDKVCQWHATGGWFSLGTPVSLTNKTDLHDITEILLKVALNTITLMPITIYMHYTEIEAMNVLVFFVQQRTTIRANERTSTFIKMILMYLPYLCLFNWVNIFLVFM